MNQSEIIRIEKAAVDLWRADHCIDRAPGIELFEVADDARRRLTTCLDRRPVSKQAPHYGWLVGGNDLVLEDLSIHILPFLDIVQCCPLCPVMHVSRSGRNTQYVD